MTPHWGPNMTSAPVRHVRRAATALVEAGATLVAGHSAHVPHGVAGPVLYDLGDFLDDYRVDPQLRNDLGLLFLVTLDGRGPIRLEALPLKLEYCHTRLATGDDVAWMRRRFRAACADPRHHRRGGSRPTAHQLAIAQRRATDPKARPTDPAVRPGRQRPRA